MADQDILATPEQVAAAIAAWPAQPMYRHYKGTLYRVLHLVRTEGDDANFTVVYVSLSDGQMWARAAADFFGTTVRGSYSGPRFVQVVSG
jgi:hypothetical protein